MPDASGSIRGATSDDLSGVEAIERESFTDPWRRRSFESLLGDPRVYFGIAVAGEPSRIAGYVVTWFVEDEGEIANLAVAPGMRGRGLGGALLDSAMNLARSKGVSAIFLEVRDSNQMARRLYASRGFAELGRRRSYYRRPEEDAIILGVRLNPEASPS